MQRTLTVLKDIKGRQFFTSIVAVKHTDEARRNYLMILEQGGDSVFHRHPKDFHLYDIGSFDDETGVIDSYTPIDITPHSEVDQLLADKNDNLVKKGA